VLEDVPNVVEVRLTGLFIASCDVGGIACGWDSFDVTGERSDDRHLAVAFEPAEAALCRRPSNASSRVSGPWGPISARLAYLDHG
jgi:hypothetical protein